MDKYHPAGLEHSRLINPDDPVKVEQLREAVDRYASRKTTVPGSYAHRHYIETGHVLALGCCVPSDAAA